FTNDQIKEMTRKVSAEVDLVHQQTQNQRYGSSHIGATAKDISNVVTDAASGVVDIFHGIDKAVADTWNNFWKDGDRKSGSAGMPRPISYAVFCLKKKKSDRSERDAAAVQARAGRTHTALDFVVSDDREGRNERVVRAQR